ncbi:MAG: periplasmic heavy metal sensor [Desulfobacterales bacterium]|nr:periplasmic heavy metal sensor [Desulfobacterales bacterium]
MKQRFSIKILSVVAIVGILGFAGYAFASGGWGYHHRGDMAMNGPENGPEDCPRRGGGDGPGRGAGGQDRLSEEDAEAFDAQRQAFFDATKTLRNDLYQKQLELRSELAKAEPDTKTAAGLQTEISKLRGDFDQKRLTHQLEMRKSFPDAGRGAGQGKGYHHGSGRGSGGCRQ